MTDNFLHYDPDCPGIQAMMEGRNTPLTTDEMTRHRLLCYRCMFLAVLAIEFE